MNRYLVLIYLLGVPIVALTILYELGSAHLWLGYPFVWVNCLIILSIGPAYGQCGYYFDWFALLLDALFYTGGGYALLGCYKLLRSAKHGAIKPLNGSYPVPSEGSSYLTQFSQMRRLRQLLLPSHRYHCSQTQRSLARWLSYSQPRSYRSELIL